MNEFKSKHLAIDTGPSTGLRIRSDKSRSVTKPGNGSVVDLVGPSQSSRALPSQKPFQGLILLMGVELRLPAKLGSAGSSSLSAVVGALDDPLSLVLG